MGPSRLRAGGIELEFHGLYQPYDILAYMKPGLLFLLVVWLISLCATPAPATNASAAAGSNEALRLLLPRLISFCSSTTIPPFALAFLLLCVALVGVILIYALGHFIATIAMIFFDLYLRKNFKLYPTQWTIFQAQHQGLLPRTKKGSGLEDLDPREMIKIVMRWERSGKLVAACLVLWAVFWLPILAVGIIYEPMAGQLSYYAATGWAFRLISVLAMVGLIFPDPLVAMPKQGVLWYRYDVKDNTYGKRHESRKYSIIRLIVFAIGFLLALCSFWASIVFFVLAILFGLMTKILKDKEWAQQMRGSLIMIVGNPLWYICVKVLDLVQPLSSARLELLARRYLKAEHSFESFWTMENDAMSANPIITARLQNWLAIAGFNRNASMALVLGNLVGVAVLFLGRWAGMFLIRYIYVRIKYFEYGIFWVCLADHPGARTVGQKQSAPGAIGER